MTRAFEEDGTQYFELKVPKTGKPTEFDVESNLYTKLNGELLQSPTYFTGTFNVTKCPAALVKKGMTPDRPCLRLGDSPSGQMLRELEIEEQPFQFRYAERMSSCFDLPNRSYVPPFTLD